MMGLEINKHRERIPAEVLEELSRGNYAAFELVYKSFQANIRRFILSLTKDIQVAEDIMQDAFVYLWEKREQIDPRKNILNYLFHIVRSMLINRLRKQQVADRYLREMDFEEVSLYAADASMIAEETELLIEVVVEHMPKQRQAIYRMSRQEGLTHQEIAEKMGIDTRNVRTQLHYAVKEIKEILKIFLLFFILP